MPTTQTPFLSDFKYLYVSDSKGEEEYESQMYIAKPKSTILVIATLSRKTFQAAIYFVKAFIEQENEARTRIIQRRTLKRFFTVWGCEAGALPPALVDTSSDEDDVHGLVNHTDSDSDSDNDSDSGSAYLHVSRRLAAIAQTITTPSQHRFHRTFVIGDP